MNLLVLTTQHSIDVDVYSVLYKQISSTDHLFLLSPYNNTRVVIPISNFTVRYDSRDVI